MRLFGTPFRETRLIAIVLLLLCLAFELASLSHHRLGPGGYFATHHNTFSAICVKPVSFSDCICGSSYRAPRRRTGVPWKAVDISGNLHQTPFLSDCNGEANIKLYRTTWSLSSVRQHILQESDLLFQLFQVSLGLGFGQIIKKTLNPILALESHCDLRVNIYRRLNTVFGLDGIGERLPSYLRCTV